MTIDPERLDWIRRHSRIAIDREGRFSHDGRPVEHPRVNRLFHAGLRQGAGGEVTLHVGTQWCYVESVADTAFFVVKAAVAADRVRLVLADGSTEDLAPETLGRRGPEDVYCTLSGGRRARFLRDALAALAPHLEERDGAIGLALGSEFHPISLE